MKVLHVTTWKTRCGIAACSESLVDQLTERGVKNDVFPVVPHEIRTMIGEDLKELFQKICREAKTHDLVHIQHEFGFFSSPHMRSSIRNFGRLLGMLKATRRPTLVTFHTDPHFSLALPTSRDGLRSTVLHQMWRWLVARHFRGRRGVKALVHTMKGRQALVHSGVPSQNVFTIPMGHEPRQRTLNDEEKRAAKIKLGISPDATVLSMFGFIAPYKGHRVAVQALRALPEKYVLAIIGGRHPDAGEDSTLDDVFRLWRKRNPKRLLVTGYVDRATIDQYQAATDICLAPYMGSFNLSASAALTWALTSGRPVIASGIPAFEDINRRGNCLMTVTPGAPYELAWNIKRLADDKAMQAQLVQNAHAYSVANSWSVAADRNLGIYRTVLSERGRSQGLSVAPPDDEPASRSAAHSQPEARPATRSFEHAA